MQISPSPRALRRPGGGAESPRKLRGPTVGLVSLGCPKNLVDSENILGTLAAGGFVPTPDPAQAEVLIVNTCGFIEPAKQESIDTLLEMARYKETGRCRYLVAAGCLVQRYAEELQRELPEVDAWVGFGEYARIDRFLRDLYGGKIEGVPVRVSDPAATLGIEEARLRLTPPHYAYLRISEGCDKTCTFCSIPAIRGRFRSKPLEATIEEARELARSGARELNVISQDTLHWGVDLYGKQRLATLLEGLARVEGVEWIRLWYLYPGKLPPGLADLMASEKKILPYLDMPIQHAHPEMLRAMRRPWDVDAMRKQLAALRERIPGLVLRTSVIVGFPGEEERHVEALLEFLAEARFERTGIFLYSREEGTRAAELPGQVPERTKKARQRRVAALGREMLLAHHRSRVGRVEEALVDGPASQAGWLRARTAAEGPEVDPVVLLPDGGGTSGGAEPPPDTRVRGARAGQRVRVRIESTRGVDLVGSLVGKAGGKRE